MLAMTITKTTTTARLGSRDPAMSERLLEIEEQSGIRYPLAFLDVNADGRTDISRLDSRGRSSHVQQNSGWHTFNTETRAFEPVPYFYNNVGFTGPLTQL